MRASTTHLRVRAANGPAAALVGLLAVAWFASGVVAVVLVPAASAAVVDARSGRLPDRLVAASLVPTAVWLAYRVFADGPGAIVTVVAGAVLLAAPLLVLHLVAPAAMGFGDVKLAGALGASIATVEPRLAVVVLAVGAGLTATFGLVTRRSSVAFGPGLVAGTAAAALLSGWGNVAWR